MTKSDVLQAIKQICDEKGLSYESVIETVEMALAAAYRKDFGQKNQNVVVGFEPETGKTEVWDVKTVVEDLTEEELEAMKKVQIELSTGDAKEWPNVPKKEEEEEQDVKKFNPKTEIMLSKARDIDPEAKLGDILRLKLEIPQEFGRMAAQTAKQVIIQRLREAERENVYAEFKSKEGSIATGIVQRYEGRIVLIDLGRATGLLLPSEQIEYENYAPGQRIKVIIFAVKTTPKGPEILVSRSHPDMVKVLFSNEVPEIVSGVVEIKAVSREAGARSKIAVVSHEENIDPIGSCVGQRGTRVQTVINELGGEKIDIIPWSEDPQEFIANAMSPAKVLNVELKNPEAREAEVWVRDEQLSLAIGKAGQNVRLAAKLTGWRLDVKAEGGEFLDRQTQENSEETSIPDNAVPPEKI